MKGKDWKEKARLMVDLYLQIAGDSNFCDSEIIDTLTDIFDRQDLEEFGYGEYVKEYFDAEEKIV